MKFFANKNIWKKLVIAFLIIWSVTFVAPKRVSASFGVLIVPVCNLFTVISDGLNWALNWVFFRQEDTIVTVTASETTAKQKIPLILKGFGKKFLDRTTKPFTTAYEEGKGLVLMFTARTKSGVDQQFSMGFEKVTGISSKVLNNMELELPILRVSPYDIFADSDGIFSVNIFEKQNTDSFISKVRTVVAGWYNTLKLIAIISMMSVLVYIGIRIVMSSSNESKAKYKQMIWDWLVATCLIFVMQYIMVFANVLVDSFVEIIDAVKVTTEMEHDASNNVQDKTYQSYTRNGVEGFIIGAIDEDGDGKYEKEDEESKALIEKAYIKMVNNNLNDNNGSYKEYFFTDATLKTVANDEKDAKVMFWPGDDFSAQARIRSQIAKRTYDNNESDLQMVSYTIIYFILTLFTVAFVFVYIKRLIYMIFLTLISPLVAITYPIDKVGDGKAQAFNFWFKEYVYNLMLQPLHLLIYMILVGMAMQFAVSNPIYVIVCLGFILSAEKLIKEMFGFKGSTPGTIPGMAVGTFIGSMANRAANRHPSGGNGSSGGDKGGKNNNSSPRNFYRGNPALNSVFNPGNPPPGNPPPGNPPPGNPPPGNPPPGNPPPGNPPPGNPPPGDPRQMNSPQRFRRLRATGRVIGNRVGSTLGNGRWWAKKGRGLGRWGLKNLVATPVSHAVRAIPTVAAATTVGIMSGSFSKGLATAGALTAINHGKAKADGEKFLNYTSDFAEELNEARFTPEENLERSRRKYRNEFMDDKEKRRYLIRNIGEDAYKQLVNSGDINTFLDAGFNEEQIANAYDLRTELGRDRYSNEQIRDIVQMHASTGSINTFSSGGKEIEEAEKTLRQRYKRSGIPEDQIQGYVDNTMQYFDALSRISQNRV